MSDNKELVPQEKIEQNKSLQELFAKEMIQTPDKKDGFNNISELFKLMSSIYGDSWNRQYENDSSRDVWAIVLWEKQKQTILNAVKVCMNKHQKFPPNLAQFQSICEEIESDEGKDGVEKFYKRLT